MENAYLFAWNPKNWEFKDLEKNIDEIKDFGKTTMAWKVQSTKKIKLGDRAYIMRVGDSLRGIFASGIISKLPYEGPYFKNPALTVPMVNIDLDVFLNPFLEENLSLNEITTKIPSKQFWTPHQSGIQIKKEVQSRLDTLWKEFSDREKFRLLEIPIESLFEGDSYQRMIKSYERSVFAREICLAQFGYNCSVCDMDFENVYGEIGRKFIHVHHINELAGLISGRYTNPIADLRPVCPNCHAMLHKEKPAMAINDLKNILELKRAIKK